MKKAALIRCFLLFEEIKINNQFQTMRLPVLLH